MKRAKYVAEATCPRATNGYSTGCFPIQVSIKNVATKTQKVACENGRKEFDSFLEVLRNGIRKRTKIAATKAITPPNFLGMDRSIA